MIKTEEARRAGAAAHTSMKAGQRAHNYCVRPGKLTAIPEFRTVT